MLKKALIGISVGTVLGAGAFLLIQPNPSEKGLPQNQQVQSVNQTALKKEIQPKIKVKTFDFGYLPQSQMKKSLDPFDIFKSNDKKMTEKYALPYTEQEMFLYIVPTTTDYDIDVGKISLEDRRFVVEYDFGQPKIPRVVGHDKMFRFKGYGISLKDFPTAEYKVEVRNKQLNESFETKLDFNKPFFESKWDTGTLYKGVSNNLLYATNRKGKYEVWSLDLGTNKVQKFFSRDDLQLQNDTYPSIGKKNIHDVTLDYNPFSKKYIFSFGQDIYEVDVDGKDGRPLQTRSEMGSERDYLTHVDVDPQIRNNGTQILFKRISDPLKSELYSMNVEGEDVFKLSLPMDRFVKEYKVFPSSKKIALILSSFEGDGMNGRDHLYVWEEGKKAKKIGTVGYSLKDLAFGEGESLLFSMKEHSTTSNGDWNLWKVNANNTNLKQLTPQDEMMELFPTKSESSSTIFYYASSNGGEYDLWKMNADGSERMVFNEKIRIDAKNRPLLSNGFVFLNDVKGNIYKIKEDFSSIQKIAQGFK